MSEPTPPKVTPAAQTVPATDRAVENRFRTLAQEWYASVNTRSSRTQTNLRAYQEIIELGRPVIPCVLRELRDHGGFWFRALSTLTGENPIPDYMRGDALAMTRAWIEWGRDRGLV